MKVMVIIILLGIASSTQAQFLDNPVIAHRGAWKEDQLPQNSIAALHRAIELGCSATEFDVQLTKDNILVVNHDADHFGIDIATSTYADLLTIPLANGESIPTAEEYLREGMKQGKTKPIFELKSSRLGIERTLEAAKLTVDLVKSLEADDWVEYILFSYEGAKKIIELDPSAKVSYLNGNIPPAQAKADGFYGLDYNFGVYKNNPDWISQAQELGLIINAWTVNTEEEMVRLLDQNAQFITTDQPELLFELLTKRQ